MGIAIAYRAASNEVTHAQFLAIENIVKRAELDFPDNRLFVTRSAIEGLQKCRGVVSDYLISRVTSFNPVHFTFTISQQGYDDGYFRLDKTGYASYGIYSLKE
jgi:hypothetical protein